MNIQRKDTVNQKLKQYIKGLSIEENVENCVTLVPLCFLVLVVFILRAWLFIHLFVFIKV